MKFLCSTHFICFSFFWCALLNYYMLPEYLDSTNSKHQLLLDFMFSSDNKN
jgi:hypothetical protein